MKTKNLLRKCIEIVELMTYYQFIKLQLIYSEPLLDLHTLKIIFSNPSITIISTEGAKKKSTQVMVSVSNTGLSTSIRLEYKLSKFS